MRDIWKSAKVGITVLLGIILAVYIYRMITEGTGDKDTYTVTAHFDDVQGLLPKSRVAIAGIPVGEIEKIYLDGNRAKVAIKIDDKTPLYENATVEMRSVSLLGEKMLVIEPGTKDRKRLEDGQEILNAQEAASTDDLMRTAGDIADDVKQVTNQLSRAFGTDEAGNQMKESLAALNESLVTINRTLQKNEQVINNTLANVEYATEEGAPKLVEILENVRQSTKSVNDIIQKREGEIDNAVGDVDDTVSSIKRASNQLESVLGDIKNITGRTADGRGTIGRLTSDEALIDEVEGAVEGVNDIIGGIARLRTIVELRSEYNMLANTFKSTFSLRLQTRENRYFLIQLVDDPRGSVSISQTTVRRSPALQNEPAEYQETRLRREDGIVFTLQIARRIAFATLRFGIMESSGGIGLDLHFFDDRFEVNTDLFNFGYQTLPRLRARIAYEIVNRLWVVGGIDDILNDNRDFFLGMQLRFDDTDLKSILPFAGGLAAAGS